MTDTKSVADLKSGATAAQQNDIIPFLDLVTQHSQMEHELMGVLQECLQNACFVNGPMVEEFEASFATFCGVSECVGVGSGTDALRFALIACGIKPGDVVVTVPNTFIATTEAISQAGAVPEFVDIDERTCNMSVDQLRRYLEDGCTRGESGRLVSKRSGRPVRAIVPVHLYGQMADMEPILDIAEHHDLIVIEDACQAHGAEYWSRRNRTWMKAGSMGHAAAFSFYPGKNLGACGEAGAVTTNNPKIATQVRRLRDHGQAKKYYHCCEGYNGRLDAVQAGILSLKLKHLSDWNEQRRQAAARYRDLFAAKGELKRVLLEAAWAKAVYHLFVIRDADRENLIRRLAQAGIGTGIHYPVPLHLQEAYEHLGYACGSFPVAERVGREIVSLPMFPGLTEAQQRRVVEAVTAQQECLQPA